MKQYSKRELDKILNSAKLPNYETNINKRINQIGKFDFESRLRHYRPMSVFDPAFLGGRGNAFNDTGLKAYWKFNEASGNIINVSESAADLGSAADLSVTGATYSQPGIIGNSLLFDGVNDFCQAGSSLSQFNFMHNTTAIFTLIMWYKLGASPPSTQRGFFGTMGLSSSQTGICMAITTSRELHFICGDGTTPAVLDHSGVIFPNDTNWHMLMVKWDYAHATNNLMYSVDNGSVTTVTKANATASTGDATSALQIGRSTDPTWWSGNIDETSLWNRLLTASEITTLYNGGVGRAIY